LETLSQLSDDEEEDELVLPESLCRSKMMKHERKVENKKNKEESLISEVDMSDFMKKHYGMKTL
jgi:hypothetical protein